MFVFFVSQWRFSAAVQQVQLSLETATARMDTTNRGWNNSAISTPRLNYRAFNANLTVRWSEEVWWTHRGEGFLFVPVCTEMKSRCSSSVTKFGGSLSLSAQHGGGSAARDWFKPLRAVISTDRGREQGAARREQRGGGEGPKAGSSSLAQATGYVKIYIQV